MPTSLRISSRLLLLWSSGNFVDDDGAAVDIFQPVEAAQKGRLARSRRPDDHHDFAAADIGGKILQARTPLANVLLILSTLMMYSPGSFCLMGVVSSVFTTLKRFSMRLTRWESATAIAR